MLNALLAIAIGVALVWLALELSDRHSDVARARQREAAWLPTQLRDAELLYAEPKAMKIDSPVKAIAKVDRAYRIGDTVVLVELKTRNRHRAYEADVVELSVQRLVIEGHGAGAVADIAYVLTQHPATGHRQRHTVRLLSRERTVALIQRYQSIRDGSDPGEPTQDLSRCARCVHQRRCRPDAAAANAART